jgi:hypothetical protein
MVSQLRPRQHRGGLPEAARAYKDDGEEDRACTLAAEGRQGHAADRRQRQQQRRYNDVAPQLRPRTHPPPLRPVHTHTRCLYA